jgi:hypothetical protein
VAIFGDPHNMQVDRKRRMGAMARVTHVLQSTQNLRKLPPKGGGFAPPNWRQNKRRAFTSCAATRHIVKWLKQLGA